jgi:hypothetical protein
MSTGQEYFLDPEVLLNKNVSHKNRPIYCHNNHLEEQTDIGNAIE